MPQRSGGGYSDYLAANGVPRVGPARAGADSLPGRSLGGHFVPSDMYYLYNNPHGATRWEDQAYEMDRQSQTMRPSNALPSPGLGYGAPLPQQSPDGSFGYPGRYEDKVLTMIANILNKRFPN